MSSSGVEFEEPTFEIPTVHSQTDVPQQKSTPAMIKMLINSGIVQSEHAASIVLVFISSLFFTGAVLFYLFNPFL